MLVEVPMVIEPCGPQLRVFHSCKVAVPCLKATVLPLSPPVEVPRFASLPSLTFYVPVHGRM